VQLVTATGRRLWVRTAGIPIFEDGKVVRVLGGFQARR
jgi:rsbT co-antagonist protein RsbR